MEIIFADIKCVYKYLCQVIFVVKFYSKFINIINKAALLQAIIINTVFLRGMYIWVYWLCRAYNITNDVFQMYFFLICDVIKNSINK